MNVDKGVLKFAFGVVAIVALTAILIVAFGGSGDAQQNSANQEYFQDFRVVVDYRVSERALLATQIQSEIRAVRRVITASVMHAPRTDVWVRTSALDALRAEAGTMHDIALDALARYEESALDDPLQSEALNSEHTRLITSIRTALNAYMEVFMLCKLMHV